MSDTEIILKAIDFARKMHGDQIYGSKPYMYHISKVASWCRKFGGTTTQLVACILHDTIEDTPATAEMLKKMFGSRVARIVDLVTNQSSKEATYKRIRLDKDAVFVKLCDRIANTYEGAKNDKYRKEHMLFKKILYRPGEYEEMWKMLDSILESK